jgi:DNA (cytosine-5)-methyltransferase 1
LPTLLENTDPNSVTDKKEKKRSTARPRVLALFSGAGGLDLGFCKAGFDVAVSSDISAVFLKSIERNIGRYYPSHHHSICADVSTAAPEVYGRGPFDFMIGGPPCQSFSAAGRRAGGVHGINDFRGSLFWHYCRLIEHFSPKGFLFENVRGILQANKGRDWQAISQAFNGLGYQIYSRVLDAADYGVPQHRERLIVVGLKKGEFLFPAPTHGPASQNGRSYVSAGEALLDLDDPTEIVPPYPGKWGSLLAEVPPGMNYLFFTEEMGHPTPKFAWRSRFSDFLYKLDPKLPSKTIVASLGAYGGPFHWRGRKLTLAEHKRLQSFPDDYEIEGSLLTGIKQVGNSVAPRFAEQLAKAVLRQVFNSTDTDVELMRSDYSLVFDARKRDKARNTKAKRAISSRSDIHQIPLQFHHGTDICHEKHEKFIWHYSSPRQPVEEPSKCTKRFDIDSAFSGGAWRVSAIEARSRRRATIRLGLIFSQSLNRQLASIDVELRTSSLENAAIAWDLVDWCVRQSSSFSSIQPLYGHFTEPHPKFSLRVDVSDVANDGLQRFIQNTSAFEYAGTMRPKAELALLFPKMSARESVLYLRELGWDIRTHETNRAIPQKFFRSVYPFTMSLSETRFTTWRDKGTHRNADRTSIPKG